MFQKETKSFKATTALAQFRLVAPSATSEFEVGYPAADYHGPLFVTQAAAAAGANVACLPLEACTGTVIVTVAAAVARLARVSLTGAVGKVDDTGVGPCVGVALQAATADEERIEVAITKGTGLHHAAIADSTAVTASAVATAFSNASKTIDGGALRVGDILRIKAAGICTSTTGAETVKADILVGTEIVATTGAIDPANGDVWRLDVDVAIRAVGASGKIQAHGTQGLGVPGTATAKPFCTAELSEDISSAALPVKCQVTNSSTGESILCHAFSVELVRN